LIDFKAGAFSPGLPVQPVIIKYKYKHFNPSYIATGPPIGPLIFRLLCQFSNRVQIQYLDVYYPSSGEKANAELFANNVKRIMSDAGSLPTSESTLYDGL